MEHGLIQAVGDRLVDAGRAESPRPDLVVDGRDQPVSDHVVVGIVGVIFHRRGLGDRRRRRLDRLGGDHHEGVELAAADPVGELQQHRGATSPRPSAVIRRSLDPRAGPPCPSGSTVCALYVLAACSIGRVELAGAVDDRDRPRPGVHPLGDEQLQHDRQPHDHGRSRSPMMNDLVRTAEPNSVDATTQIFREIRMHGKRPPAHVGLASGAAIRTKISCSDGRATSNWVDPGPGHQGLRAGPADRPATSPPGSCPDR